MELLKKEQDEWVKQLMGQITPSLIRYLARHLDVRDGMQILQETYEIARENIETLEARRDPAGWLLKTACARLKDKGSLEKGELSQAGCAAEAPKQKQWNQKSGEELRSELEQALRRAAVEGNSLEPELVRAYIDVVDARGDGQNPHGARPKLRLRRILLPAAIVCGLIALMSAMLANGSGVLMDLYEHGNLLLFGNCPSGSLVLDEPAENGYRSLTEALAEEGLGAVAPTWIPEGYALKNVTVDETPQYTNYTAGYSNGDSSLVIRIMHYDESNSLNTGFTQNGDSESIYEADGVNYVLTENLGVSRVIWNTENSLCSITGTLSKNQLIEMIESIRER